MDNFNKTHGCFLGVMIGDALGAAVEMMKLKDRMRLHSSKSFPSIK